MAVEKLKPCPFCGNKRIVLRQLNGSYGYTPDRVVVGCDMCDLKPAVPRPLETYDWNKRKHVDVKHQAYADVIKIWNTRSYDD